MTTQWDLLITGVSFLSAWDISLACRPTWLSPMSPFDLLPRHQRGHRVDNYNIDRAGTDHRLRDLQRLVAAVRLGDVQLVNIDADVLRIHRIQRMLRIDKSGDAAPSSGLPQIM